MYSYADSIVETAVRLLFKKTSYLRKNVKIKMAVQRHEENWTFQLLFIVVFLTFSVAKLFLPIDLFGES